MSLLSDRAALIFLSQDSFKRYIHRDDFEHALRWQGLYDLWLQAKESAKVRSIIGSTFGREYTDADILTLFFQEMENRGHETLANVILWIFVPFSKYDIKAANNIGGQIFDYAIPALGYKLEKTNGDAKLIKIGDTTQEEVPINNELEQMLNKLGSEFLKTRKHGWELVESGKPENMKNSIDEYRRLFDNVLWKIAPDDKVMKSQFYEKDKHRKLEEQKPFRNERIKYIIAKGKYREKEIEYIESFANLVSKFYELVNKEVHLLDNIVKETRFVLIITDKLLYLVQVLSNLIFYLRFH